MIKYTCVEGTKSYWYAWNVVEGNIIACEDVINACNRFLNDIEKSEDSEYPYFFDLNQASRIENASRQLKFTSGARAGQNIELAPPQAFELDNIYCWRFKDNHKKRRFRTATIMKTRKNAKSFDMAFIAIMAMLDENENEVYSFASKRDQAKISFEQCKSLIRSNKKVARKFKLNKTEIIHKTKNSKFEPLAAEAKTLDGTSPGVAIIDEAFVVPVAVKNSAASGTGARLSPLVVSISTSYDVSMVGNWAYEDMIYTKKVNSGEYENDRHFGLIYQLDSEAEVENEEMWEKANPLIPYSPTLLEDLRENYKIAKTKASAMRDFKIKRMNLILDGVSIDKYIHLPSWIALEEEYIDFTDRYVFYGIDLSITTDLSAVTMCSYNEETDMFEFKSHAFAPRENIEEMELRDNIPYRQFEEQGYITLCDGRDIDQDYIIEWVIKTANEEGHKIAMIAYDPYNSDYMLKEFEKLGIPTLEIRQGFRMLSGPTKLFRQYVYNSKLRHEFNPIYNWCIGNCITAKDRFNNEILDKVKSVQKIDLAAAGIFSFLACNLERDNYCDREYDDSYTT